MQHCLPNRHRYFKCVFERLLSVTSYAYKSLLLLCISYAVSASESATDNETLRVFVAKSAFDSGVVKILIDDFTLNHPEYNIELNSRGALEVLEQARLGHADLVITHHPPAEEQFVAEGYGTLRTQLMYSEYALYGPPNQFPEIKKAKNINDALSLLAQEEFDFFEPSVRSGTFRKIKELWATAAIETSWPGYQNTGSSGLATLKQAALMGAFTIVDMGTYINNHDELANKLILYFRGDIALRNIYSLIVINNNKIRQANEKAAKILRGFLISDKAQDLIRLYGEKKFKSTFLVPAAIYDFPLRIQKQQQELQQAKNRLILIYTLLIFVFATIVIGITLYLVVRNNREKRKRLETQNEKYLENIYEVNRQTDFKSQLLANMSHEIRTPINVILGYGELLVEAAENEQNSDSAMYMQKITNSGKHLLEIVNNILDFSKVESGKMILNSSNVVLDKFLDEVNDLVMPLTKINNNTFKIEQGEGIINVNLDELKIKQVLINLISNALKFTKNDTVVLKAYKIKHASTSELIFLVIDNGIGIAKDKQEKIFTAFEQANDDTSLHYGGTGLGLGICKSFLTLMGGTIDIESDVGKGACFTIRIPYTETDIDKNTR